MIIVCTRLSSTRTFQKSNRLQVPHARTLLGRSPGHLVRNCCRKIAITLTIQDRADCWRATAVARTLKGKIWRRGWESNPRIKVLQTSPLPLGYRASRMGGAKNPRVRRGRRILERETGFEPATSTLARSHSTTELLPLAVCDYSESLNHRANESGRSTHENVTRAKAVPRR